MGRALEAVITAIKAFSQVVRNILEFPSILSDFSSLEHELTVLDSEQALPDVNQSH